MEKISFAGNNGDAIEFYVIEKTTLGGVDYMLVTESETEDGDAYVLKDLSKSGDSEGVYEIVDDEDELQAVGQVFGALLEDIDILQ
ncbi:Protein of unknown function [Lachnospiraceae bacterium YSD2013]|jgi:hypothetical protein|nr:DUF1292 domain-containing protein [Lachnospiraceae bacterium]SCX03384.1 Protein of unknown function [Lachnospiraceae bacterium YSD2013]MBO4823927.1 DUF1292 domain-containing protein [Lachnospiraceae bacterium]MBR5762606.1 DUF1292 domain-containing protein [Lachnospiraceae bacterium]MBR5994255.1 DUF1292 domain-containing protein [Lachnospiraceae bacterium]